jgi:hypothetical protein
MASPLSFKNGVTSIRGYAGEVKVKYYDLDPEFQREYIKLTPWKQKMIGHIVWTRQTGILYFHPVKRAGASTHMECLDGKSRSSAIIEFMNDGFRLKDLPPGVRHLDGKLFSEWSADEQFDFGGIQCQIAEANRTMSKDEINIFFNNIKTPSDISIGESLHCDVDGVVNKLVRARMTGEFKDFVKKLWANDNRYEHLTVIARCVYWTMNPVSRTDPGEAKLKVLWHYGEGITPSIIHDVCENMMKAWLFTRDAKVCRMQYAAVFCPFFMLFSTSTSVEDLSKIHARLVDSPFKNLIIPSQDRTVFSRYEHMMTLARDTARQKSS